ncbi:MAG TPA: glycosyltransferase [Microvirga sp.]|jgi:glycosyltransferase involved in cell wall biosynthesis|nr:glycosyltransferase [Microvirga sp.]
MSSVPKPTTSVILPVKDGECFVLEALASVLGQDTNANLEIIVIDDGSSDRTSELIRQALPEVTIIRTEGRGSSGARNLGLTRSAGDFVGFIDHDDLWPAGKLKRQLADLERDPDLDIVVGRTQYEWLPGREPIAMPSADGNNSLHNVNLGACLFRRRVFDRIGLFAADMRYAEDHDLFLRAREAGLRFCISQEIGLVYRQHGTNMTKGRSMGELGVFEALRRSLHRRAATDELKSMARLTDRSQ